MIEYFTKVLEAHPLAGYVSSASTTLASASGTILTFTNSATHVATAAVGLIGMTLGALGGYYTFRIQRSKWKSMNQPKQ